MNFKVDRRVKAPLYARLMRLFDKCNPVEKLREMEGTVGHLTVRRIDFISIPREIVSTILDFLATPTYL